MPKDDDRGALTDIAGLAIWASVSEEVAAKIREQINAGAFPNRLGPEDWTSAEINWLMDVIAPGAEATTLVIANFRQVVKEGDLNMHPIVGRLVDKDVLERLGARRLAGSTDGGAA